MTIYQNQATIQTFIKQAQAKLGYWANLHLVEDHQDFRELSWLLQKFLLLLDSPYNTLDEPQLLRYIDYLSVLCDLNPFPYLEFPGYQILAGGSMPGNGDLDEERVKQLINQALARMKHNKLKGLEPDVLYQGFVVDERFHISKDMYDFLWNLMNPFSPPSIGLQLATTPQATNGLYELGTTIQLVNLLGSVNLNGGKKLLSYRYLRGQEQLASFTPITAQMRAYADTSGIKKTTTYTLSATFEKGGTLNTSQSVIVVPPLYYGVRKAPATVAQVQVLTKFLAQKPSGFMPLAFAFPADNPDREDSNKGRAYFLFPRAWGKPTKAPIDSSTSAFDGILGWNFEEVSYTLLDGTTQEGYLGLYEEAPAGSYTFYFSWS